MRQSVHTAHQWGTDLLGDHRDKLDLIAETLIEVETLNAHEFVALFDGTADTASEPSESTPPPSGSEQPAGRKATDRPKPALDMPPAPAPA